MAEQKADEESTVTAKEDDEKRLLQCPACRMLLRDPVQFKCLHNACKRCLPHGDGQDADGLLACPACNSATDLTVAETNSFVSNTIDSLKLYEEPCQCDTCSEDDKTESEVRVWCSVCLKRLCATCFRWHTKLTKDHKVASMEEARRSNDFTQVISPLCQIHGKAFELLCFQCDSPKCDDCVQLCIKSGHDVEDIRCNRAATRVQEIRRDMENLQRASDLNRTPASRRSSHASDMSTLRRAGSNELQRIKTVLLDGTGKAHEESESLLQSRCDSAAAGAFRLTAGAADLRSNVDAALHYCSTLVNSADAATVLQQHKHMLPYLKSLLSEVGHMQMLTDCVKCTVIEEGGFSNSLRMALETWTEVQQQPSTREYEQSPGCGFPRL